MNQNAPVTEKRNSGARSLLRLIVVITGITGLRLDHWRRPFGFCVWVLSWTVCLCVYYAVFELRVIEADIFTYRSIALAYAAVFWLIYYCGLSATLGTRLRRLVIDRLGETNADTVFHVVLGVTFLNQGLCQTAIMKAYGMSMPTEIPAWVFCLLGGSAVVVGAISKIWATYLAGLAPYYYRDMFLGRITRTGCKEVFVVSGPYRTFRNPMYGIGNLQAYGGAIWFRSWEGLLAAAVFQASIYIFYFLFERPFIKKTYSPCS